MENKGFQKTASLPDCVTSGSQPIVNGAVKNPSKLHAIVEFCGGWRFCIVFVCIFSCTYDAVGYVNALGTIRNTVTTTYDALGRPVGTSGATYPTRNEYDTANRTTALSTTRDGTAWDATHWNYDLPTGLVTNKVYADGSAVSYAYTPDGKLAARTWARGLATAYAYNPDGLLTGVSYSDGLSPLPLGEGQGEGAAPYSVTLAYDAFLRLASASNAVAAYAYANDALGTATNETVTLGGTVSTLTRGMDSRHRLAALRVGDAPPVQYGYDVENRLSTVSNSAFVAEYNYTSDGWDAGYGITLTNGVTLARNLTRDPYRRSLITAITNTVNGAATASLVYDYDKQNRVTSRNYDTFSYNARSEITAASVQSNAYAYAYDSIGNHTTASVNAATTAYTANNLNQYTTIDAITPSYDADGNMTWDGRFSYAYDAENRLIAAYSNNVCVVSNAYDHMSRRVLKWTPCHTTTFVYDGWNLVQETISTASGTTTNHYVWGKDLSGTMQGAGGVGGLLAVSLNGAWCFPFYDNNGNITAYVDEQGVIVAEYVYDAYGGTIAKSGAMADAFAHRFSTKYFDAESGLYYYGYRFYDPIMHRWLNRDPIEEKGGLNLYLFIANFPSTSIDILGLVQAADLTVVMATIEAWETLGWVFAPRLARHSLDMGRNRKASADELEALQNHPSFTKRFNERFFREYACGKGVGTYPKSEVIHYTRARSPLFSDIGSAYGRVAYSLSIVVTGSRAERNVKVTFTFDDKYDFSSGTTLNPVHAFNRLQQAGLASVYNNRGSFEKEYKICCTPWWRRLWPF